MADPVRCLRPGALSKTPAPCRGLCLRRGQPLRGGSELKRYHHKSPRCLFVADKPRVAPQQQRTAVSVGSRAPDEEQPLPLYVGLEPDVVSAQNSIVNREAVKAGLRAMRSLGVHGVVVDVYWGVVEGSGPRQYEWSAYQQLLQLIKEAGLKARVCLCFNAVEDKITLPKWVLEVGTQVPDIFYTDKRGVHNIECLTLGIDELPVLQGRTALDCYADLMRSFSEQCGRWLGGTVTDVVVGMGPRGVAQYPSHPRDSRWNHPGVGEFQCYDKFMLATLRACAQQVSQHQWGLSGPHDAGTYTQWPHQTGFFAHAGSWDTPYGRFFLQLYSRLLVRHVDRVLCRAVAVLSERRGLALHVRVPSPYWWYHHAAHPAELTAGIYNTVGRDGYLPLFHTIAKHGAGVCLQNADLRNDAQHGQALCGPEELLRQQRTVAAALQLSVTLESSSPAAAFSEAALQQMMDTLFERATCQGIDLPLPEAAVYNNMSAAVFEPNNWNHFKAFVGGVGLRAAALSGRPVPVTAAAAREGSAGVAAAPAAAPAVPPQGRPVGV